jgi:hypothetical protein
MAGWRRWNLDGTLRIIGRISLARNYLLCWPYPVGSQAKQEIGSLLPVLAPAGTRYGL